MRPVHFRGPGIVLLLLLCSMTLRTTAQSRQRTDSFLLNLLKASPDPVMQQVLALPDKYRVQIIYTRIDRDAANRPALRQFYFNVGDSLYYYPASTVKLPLAILTLEKLNRLHRPGLDLNSTARYDSSGPGERALTEDSTAEDGRSSMAQFIRKAFLISDNDAYNRMYEFVGQQDINRRLHQLGYARTRIVRQFMPLNEQENRLTNAIRFYDHSGKLIYQQPPGLNRDSFDFSRPAFVGKAYLDRHDSLISQPMNFTRHNNIPLADLQRLLQYVMFPASLPSSERFALSQYNLRFLRRYLSQYPGETSWPKYDTGVFYDSYVKFFFQKGGRKLPEGIRVFNKVGWAYGFLTDVSYVADFKNRVEYMLTATIYANDDEVLNDDKYDFESVGLPFLYALGQAVYRYELKRPRTHRPDLSVFRFIYPKRDPADQRKPVTVVDN